MNGPAGAGDDGHRGEKAGRDVEVREVAVDVGVRQHQLVAQPRC